MPTNMLMIENHDTMSCIIMKSVTLSHKFIALSLIPPNTKYHYLHVSVLNTHLVADPADPVSGYASIAHAQ